MSNNLKRLEKRKLVFTRNAVQVSEKVETLDAGVDSILRLYVVEHHQGR